MRYSALMTEQKAGVRSHSYTASVLGIGMYFKNQMVKFRADTRRYIKDLEQGKEEPDETED